MEFEVRTVGGIENCFISLPLHFIQSLQSTHSGIIPDLLALELSSRDNRVWHFGWCGSTSLSNEIEVAQHFADCVGLSDGMIVRVRATINVPKAVLVTIEPHSQDDWEVIELNAEHAQVAILKQIGILYEAMQFPLWLHGCTSVTFKVTSILPEKSVVQLVPGTEVSVAPKIRKDKVDFSDRSSVRTSQSHISRRVLMRVQDCGRKLIERADICGIELDMVLTSVALVHPTTAKAASIDPLQPVILIPKSPLRKVGNIVTSNIHEKKALDSNLIDSRDYREAVVHILPSKLVTEGYIALPRAVRLYLRAPVHTYIYVRCGKFCLHDIFPSSSFHAGHFKTFYKQKDTQGHLFRLTHHCNHTSFSKIDNEETDVHTYSTESEGASVAVFFNFLGSNNQKPSASCMKDGIHVLVSAWISAHVTYIAKNAGVEIKFLIVGSETLISFITNHQNISKSVQAVNRLQSDGDRSSLPREHLFVLRTSEGLISNRGDVNIFKVSTNNGLKGVESLADVTCGNSIIFYADEEEVFNSCCSKIMAMDWVESITTDIISRLRILLSPLLHVRFGNSGFPLPGHVLISGPPGSGKSSLAKTVAKSVEENENLLAHVVFICCSRFSMEKTSAICESISNFICEAVDHAPSLVVFDDLDSIISSSTESEMPHLSMSTVLGEFLANLMDEYSEKRACYRLGPVAFVCCVSSVEKIPPCLNCSGRFDYHVEIPALSPMARSSLLKNEIEKRSLHASDEHVLAIAADCDSYDAYDMEILVDRAVHASISRFLTLNPNTPQSWALTDRDFSEAMNGFVPVAMRDITKPNVDGNRRGWEDVGGLHDVCRSIREVIELPSKFPRIFSRAPLRLRSNVLLYGPPGCGKTHVAGAVAAAASSSLRFISVKGPELLNKYIGASEQSVRDVFGKAASAAPCILFFDEFDSIAPQRGHDNTGVTDRVVNQFLTELDGVEALSGVFVFAATSRPDLLDAALLRPGRFDRLLFVDFPSESGRLDILRVLSRKMMLADDADLEAVARLTVGFSGADLQALMSDAHLAAVHQFLSKEQEQRQQPLITNALLLSSAATARPSISDAEKNKLYVIYRRFHESKKAAAAATSQLSRDLKGKRATLA